jgi:hypothetical protein
MIARPPAARIVPTTATAAWTRPGRSGTGRSAHRKPNRNGSRHSAHIVTHTGQSAHHAAESGSGWGAMPVGNTRTAASTTADMFQR